MGASTGHDSPVKDYERYEGGTIAGRCVHVIELGTHPNTHPKAKFPTKKELMIVWEIDELMEDGRPFTVYWRGTNSLSDKAHLFKLLSDWRGKKFTDEELKHFNLGKLLGVHALLNISLEKTKNDRYFNKVNSIMPLPKGMEMEYQHNEEINPLVDFGVEDLGTEEFDKLWPWVQNIVKESEEGQRFYSDSPDTGAAESPSAAPDDDDIPF